MAEQVDGQFVQSEEHLVADGAVERTIRHLHEADLERIDTVKVGLAAQGTGQHLGAHCSRDVVNCDFFINTTENHHLITLTLVTE